MVILKCTHTYLPVPYRISSNRGPGRTPTWGPLLEEIRYGFCTSYYQEVLATVASAAKHSKCKILTVFLPIEARAERRLGVSIGRDMVFTLIQTTGE